MPAHLKFIIFYYVQIWIWLLSETSTCWRIISV